MPHWIFPTPQKIPPDLLDFAGDSLLARLLVQRGLSTPAQARAFLDPAAYTPAPPEDLPDLPAAVIRLRQAIERQELVCVWGDFDADGQTAASLLVSALRSLGAVVCFYIPNRLTESHGIKIPALQAQLDRGIRVLLTCDTGIAEHQAVDLARSRGVDVIITDHHDLPERLPDALAAINPKRLAPHHPLRELPGVGVAYQLALALYRAFDRGPEAGHLLDLVALGIVADVARQVGDTRYLLQKGLECLQEPSRPGLQAVLDNIGIKTARLTEEHIGFWLAPRLNALGRLGDANQGVELLTTGDPARARVLAARLEALNDRRKMLVDQTTAEALAQLENHPALTDYNALVLAGEGWHPGVLGLVASRLAERFARPAVVLTLRPNGLAQGSARSVPGCDIHRAIRRQAHLLTSFGGHPQAAGLSLPAEHIIAFRQGLSAALAGCVADFEPEIRIDAVVPLAQIGPDLLSTIRRLAPFGNGNPAVQLACRGVAVVEEAVFGRTGQHKRVVVQDEAGTRQTFIWWGGALEPTPDGKFDLAFTLGPDEYRGGGAVQAVWLAARPWKPAVIAPPVAWLDWRELARPEAELARLVAQQPETLVWAEAASTAGVQTVSRLHLRPADTLVVWSAPPGQDVLEWAVARTRPRQVIVVGQPSAPDSAGQFMRQLMGRLKYAVRHRNGMVAVSELAAALGHRATTVDLALDWLVAQGKLHLTREDEDLRQVRPADGPSAEAGELEAMLKSALAETAAYRRFFRQAGLAVLRQSGSNR
ncbi:MAG: single-stranded-DNA-specific exonuclease RecJ [Chloroflexi bacterium]|nr:MAG: single-stranded-DNA-specific exonuclease RecJ [Chloroflexota bacterium]